MKMTQVLTTAVRKSATQRAIKPCAWLLYQPKVPAQLISKK